MGGPDAIVLALRMILQPVALVVAAFVFFAWLIFGWPALAVLAVVVAIGWRLTGFVGGAARD